jgi:hypothetical protein
MLILPPSGSWSMTSQKSIEGPLKIASTIIRRSSMVAKCCPANACFIDRKEKIHMVLNPDYKEDTPFF